MPTINKRIGKRITKNKERSQILVVTAAAILVLIAVIGLVIDVGMMFIDDARLKRAVDSAALAAALQYRQGVPGDQLTKSATEFLELNGIELNAEHPVVVTTCTEDPSMCFDSTQGVTIPRKLVKVHASANAHMAFLAVFGLDHVVLTADSTGESASLDLVLVLDTSESMTEYAPGPNRATLRDADPNNDFYGDPLRDPTVCNDDAQVQNLIDTVPAFAAGTDPYDTQNPGLSINPNDGMPGECHPFEEVKQAAMNFLDRLYFPYDRVALVTFNKGATTVLQFDEDCDPNVAGNSADQCNSSDKTVLGAAIRRTIENAIRNVNVYDADGLNCPVGQPCLPYCTAENMLYCNDAQDNWGNWVRKTDPGAIYAGGFQCGDGYDRVANPFSDPSHCSTTNLAAGLNYAGSAFRGSASSTTAIRNSSLWVVVLLTDGAADSAYFANGTPICPQDTWDPYAASSWPNTLTKPFCRDDDPSTRHCGDSSTRDTCERSDGHGGVWDPAAYDADDAARDAADYVGITQQAIIFSIGLGRQVSIDGEAGKKFLQYASETVGNGNYYGASAASDLSDVFKKIGEKIATRLAH